MCLVATQLHGQSETAKSRPCIEYNCLQTGCLTCSLVTCVVTTIRMCVRVVCTYVCMYVCMCTRGRSIFPLGVHNRCPWYIRILFGVGNTLSVISETVHLNGGFSFRSELEKYCKELVEPFTDIVSCASHVVCCTCVGHLCT